MKSAKPKASKTRAIELVAQADARQEKVDVAWLRSVVDRMPVEMVAAGDFVRAMRDDERY